MLYPIIISGSTSRIKSWRKRKNFYQTKMMQNQVLTNFWSSNHFILNYSQILKDHMKYPWTKNKILYETEIPRLLLRKLACFRHIKLISSPFTRLLSHSIFTFLNLELHLSSNSRNQHAIMFDKINIKMMKLVYHNCKIWTNKWVFHYYSFLIQQKSKKTINPDNPKEQKCISNVIIATH